MAGTPSDDMEHHPSSSTVSITVLSVEPVKFGRIFALASAEVDIDGVPIVIHGVRAIRVHPIGTRIDLPMFRDENGAWRHTITLSDEISGPIGRAVLDEFVERGLAVRRSGALRAARPALFSKRKTFCGKSGWLVRRRWFQWQNYRRSRQHTDVQGSKRVDLGRRGQHAVRPLTDAPPGISSASCA